MLEEATFEVGIRDFRASDLTTRNRFKDKLKIRIDFDGHKHKTKKEIIGGGDVAWNNAHRFNYTIESWRQLEDKKVVIRLMLSKTEVYGVVTVDLHTCATGTAEHNLPIMSLTTSKKVGRLNFFIDMEQISNVAVCFHSVQLRNLTPINKTECNPYLKYAYSLHWPAVVDGSKKATYSDVKYMTTDPRWEDIPELRFSATLKEILRESVVLHVTHHGKVTNTTLGRCNLLFRTLVDNGKTFKDEDVISFKGPLKIDKAEIEGNLNFKFLPKFAQMKAINVARKSIHTENGIYDSAPLIAGMPLPKCQIINSDEPDLRTSVPVSRSGGRSRANTATEPTSTSTSALPDKLMDGYKKEKEKKSKEEKGEKGEKEKKGKTVGQSQPFDSSPSKDKLFPHAEDKHAASPRAARRTLAFPESVTQPKDLISFSPIPARVSSTKQREVVNDPFQDILAKNPFGSPPTETYNPFREQDKVNPFV